MTQEAFGADGKPTFKDTMEHLVDSSRIAMVRYDGDPVAFSSAVRNPDSDSVDLDKDYIVHHAGAVHPDYRGEGLADLISDLSTLFGVEEHEPEDYVVVGRTTHPAFVSRYDTEEKLGGMSESEQEIVKELSSLWPGDLNGLVLKDSFQESIYPEGKLEEFKEQLSGLVGFEYSPEDGDAFLVHEETKTRQRADEALESASKAAENFGVTVGEVYPSGIQSEFLDEFYDVFIGELGGEPMSPASGDFLREKLESHVGRALEYMESLDPFAREGFTNEVLAIGPGASPLPRDMAESFPELNFVCVEPSEEMSMRQKQLLEGVENAEVRNKTIQDYLTAEEGPLAAAFGINSVQETVRPKQSMRWVNERLQPGGRALYTYPGPGTKRPVVDGEPIDRLSLDVGSHPETSEEGLHPWGRYLDQRILSEDVAEGVKLVEADNVPTSGGKKVAELAHHNGVTEFTEPPGSGGVRMTVVANLLDQDS